MLLFVGNMSIHFHKLALLRLGGISGLFLAVAGAQTLPTYTITTIAGNNTSGYTGDAGPATSAELRVPTAAVMYNGNLYIADSANNSVRFVMGSTGVITTAAGNGLGTPGFSGDVGTAGATGLASDALLYTPSGVVLDTKGNLYIADTANNVVRKVTPAQSATVGGTITTVVGVNGYTGNSWNGDGGSAALASMLHPSSMVYDSAGDLYIADTGNNVIRKVTAADGIIHTVAGTTARGYNGDNGPAVKATLTAPVGIALDASGNLYIADTGNHVIRKVAISSGTITTVVGNGTPGYAGDGAKVSFATQLNNPKGVAVDAAGNIYISDTNNSRIRVVSTNGTINTIAGTGGFSWTGDGGPATSATLNFPSQISMDAKGNIYVADTNNNVIRLLTPSGTTGGGQLPVISSGGVITAGYFGASTSVAPGTWVEIYGSNLAADTRPWAATDFTNNGQTAPLSLDRTSVTIAGLQGSIDYISPGQVNVLLPLISSGTQQMTLATAAGTSASYTVNVNTNQFAVYAPPQFKVGAGGTQYVGAVFNDGTYVMPPNTATGFTSRQAHPGETIVIYGIGFGPVINGTLPGTIAPPGLSPVSGTVQVMFGTTPVTPAYAGLSPGYFGLYQLNVVVPAIPSSDLVPLTISLNGVKGSQTLYTAVQ